jgi:hypothetical protein
MHLYLMPKFEDTRSAIGLDKKAPGNCTLMKESPEEKPK